MCDTPRYTRVVIFFSFSFSFIFLARLPRNRLQGTGIFGAVLLSLPNECHTQNHRRRVAKKADLSLSLFLPFTKLENDVSECFQFLWEKKNIFLLRRGKNDFLFPFPFFFLSFLRLHHSRQFFLWEKSFDEAALEVGYWFTSMHMYAASSIENAKKVNGNGSRAINVK